MMDSEQNEPILKLLLSLAKKHPLRIQAMAVLADPQAPLQDPAPILHVLFTTSVLWKAERRVAAWLIVHADWSEEQRLSIAETLSRTVARAMNAKKPVRTTLRWFGRGMLASMLLLLFLPGAYMNQWYYVMDLFVQSLCLTILGSLVSIPVSLWLDQRKLTLLDPVVAALGHFGRPTDLVSLATASLHRSLHASAVSAMAQVTERLHPDDYAIFPAYAVPALCHVLKTASTETAFLILRAFDFIGDGRAIASVEYLANQAIQPEMRKMALDLLPTLQQRALDSRSAASLLRASAPPSETGQNLLRAVQEQSGVDPSQLLRMATSQGNEETL